MKPILMNSESVRGILEGRKTQTRRVIKPQPIVAFWQGSAPQFQFTGFKLYSPGYDRNTLRQFCPYGQVGDRLWVREAYWEDQSGGVWGYRADGIDWPPSNCGGKSHPSIHMPRWASRITLEITGVRVERVQDISEEDAVAEGCDYLAKVGLGYMHAYPIVLRNFHFLWDSINAKRGYGWDVNPWDWALTFKVVK